MDMGIVNAAEMLALKERMREGLVSAEEFEKEREAILQAV